MYIHIFIWIWEWGEGPKFVTGPVSMAPPSGLKLNYRVFNGKMIDECKRKWSAINRVSVPSRHFPGVR
jgi:hypothetical protein